MVSNFDSFSCKSLSGLGDSAHREVFSFKMKSKNRWMMAYAFAYEAEVSSNQLIGFSKKWVERLRHSSDDLGVTAHGIRSQICHSSTRVFMILVPERSSNPCYLSCSLQYRHRFIKK